MHEYHKKKHLGSIMYDRKHLYIDGAWTSPKTEGKIEVVNPANEEIIGSVPVARESDVDAAVQAARKAFPAWSSTSVAERADILKRLSASIKDLSLIHI